ncbi:MAG: cadherin-like beta sandwich domain-containing protein [Clostridia bacterium]|nr:cadherin-like beta sandwich domain-containing protein [Clostridia bacterium]
MTKKIVSIIFAIIIVFNIKNYSNAANASIQCDSTVEANTPVNISVSGSAVQWNLNLKVNGTTIASSNEFENVQGNKAISFSGTYKPTSEGNLTITLEGSVTEASDGSTIRNFNSKTINVTKVSSNGSESNINSNSETENSTNSTDTKSNIATLSNLGIRPNDFSGFTPSKTSYSVTVPNDVESVEVYANKGHSGQTISGTGTKKLAEGANTVNVTVTAEDEETTKTYTINITRDAKKEDDEEEEKEEQEEEETTSTTFGLKELTIDGINLQPEFQADVYEYKIELKEDLQKLDLTALATEEGANIEITGNENLQEGENIITIIVKNKDDEETIAYQIIVNKVLASEEIVENQAGQEQNTILYAVIGGVSLVIIIVIIVVIVKKRKKDDDSSMPYYNIMDNFDSDEFDDVEQEDEVEDFYEETPKKKKRSKGKRYK